MNFIKSLFSSTPQQQAKYQAQEFVASIDLYQSKLALSITYQYLATRAISKCSQPEYFIKALVQKISTAKSVSSVVKLFTIIHSIIVDRQYRMQQTQYLQNLTLPIMQSQQQRKWFPQFGLKYVNYLKKLSSIYDIYIRAKSGQLKQVDRGKYLIEVYRIINQIQILFPSICTFTNTIGRYYLTSYPQFPQFYRVLNTQITMIYSYLKTIIQQILQYYRQFPIDKVQLFLKSIPEIQLVCDKMQDLLLNKYFKGKAIKSKIYFKQEKVQEIVYYLEYEVKEKLRKQAQQKEKEGQNKQ